LGIWIHAPRPLVQSDDVHGLILRCAFTQNRWPQKTYAGLINIRRPLLASL
jgi:hypothetical protein